MPDEASSRLDSSTKSSLTSDPGSVNRDDISDPYKSQNAVSDSTPPSTETEYTRLLLSSRPYICAIPSPLPTTNDTPAISIPTTAEDLELASARGWDLLKDMECMYFISGWWSYSFCHQRQVRQFHQLPPGKNAPLFPPLEDPGAPSFVLGEFGQIDAPGAKNKRERDKDGKEGKDLVVKGEKRYLVQKLGGGTTCDLTGRPRKVEIQFHCHPQSTDRIGLIKEVSTCSYLMVVYTPRLCNDVAFLPPRETAAEKIICEEIVADDQVSTWKARKKSEHDDTSISTFTTSGRPLVGNIEVGAQNLVGTPGRRISPPQPEPPQANSPDGAGNRKVGIIAKKDAGAEMKRLSNEELKKLGIDLATVEALRKELEDMAEGKGWRLEVFEGPAGRELRGVVEGEEEGEEREGSEEEYKDEV